MGLRWLAFGQLNRWLQGNDQSQVRKRFYSSSSFDDHSSKHPSIISPSLTLISFSFIQTILYRLVESTLAEIVLFSSIHKQACSNKECLACLPSNASG